MDSNLLRERMLDLLVPIIHIQGEITYDLYVWVVHALLHLNTKGSPDIQVIIDSHGGRAMHGLDIYDALRLYRGKKTGIVLSKASSMASIVLQACDVRKATRHASIFIHHLIDVLSLDDITDENKLREIVCQMKRSQGMLYEILSKRTGKSIEEIRAECVINKSKTSDEALAFNLIDEIVDGHDHI